MTRNIRRYFTRCFVRLSPSQAAGLRLPAVGVGVIGIGPVAVLFNLPKAFVKPDPALAPVISIDEINLRSRKMSTED